MRRHALPALLAIALFAAACGREDEGPPPGASCSQASDCVHMGYCVTATCVAGHCAAEPLPAGTAVDARVQGGCQRYVCDGAGELTAVVDDTVVPVDGNACTLDLCAGGVGSHPDADAGTPCAQDGGNVCDGAGACVQCRVAADCPGSDTECSTRSCTRGICDVTSVPLATPLAAQVTGDCRQEVCDGVGGVTPAPLDADLPVDGNACTEDRCAYGLASNPPAGVGTTCTRADGAGVCDGGGACVQCVTAATCPGEDGECQHRTCVGGACGIAYPPRGTPLASQTAGDCRQDVCDGAGGTTVEVLATDAPQDGDDCTDDTCDGLAASHPISAAGTACAQSGGAVCDGAGACVACNVGPDCASGVCLAHACQPPSCGDAVKNGAETDVDCGGATCAACAPPQACLVGGDCTSGVCTSLRCAAPICGDRVKNGTETDVDCGGACYYDCARDQACLGSGDCSSRNCVSGVCGGPLVTGTLPADGAADVTPATAITVSFGVTVATTSVTAQSSSGPCAGTVQLSADGFATCVGMSLSPVYYGSSSAMLQPTRALEQATPYRIRTTTGLLPYASSLGAFEPFDTPIGFTTASGGACAGALVISQVYAHGGLSGAAYRTDFVELHNNGPTPVSLDGLSVQYASATGYTWSVTPLAGTIPAGGYLLVREASGGSGGALLPAYDASGTIDLSPAGGKVVLASTTVPFTALCPTVGRLDLVGYGTSNGTPVSCVEGSSGPAPAPADSTAALVRAGGGCADGNVSAADLASRLVVPRSAATAPAVCGCAGLAVNGTGLTIEMDRCRVDRPLGLTVAAGGEAGPFYGRVDEYGITEPAGSPLPLTSELGFGPAGTDPRYAAGWTFVPASWSSQGLTEDEFQASFTAPAAGSYVYVYRFSPDGQRWTYCDPNGAGANPAAPFEPNALPALTVTP